MMAKQILTSANPIYLGMNCKQKSENILKIQQFSLIN